MPDMPSLHSQASSPEKDDGGTTSGKSNEYLEPSTNRQAGSLTQIHSHASRRNQLRPTRSYVDSHSYYSERRSDDEDDHETTTYLPTSKDDPSVRDEKGYQEVVFDGLDDPMNPKGLPTWRKWSIVLVLACGSLCVTFASSAYTSTYHQMNAEFGSSVIVSTLGLSLFVFGLGLSPMMLGPLSEFYGRRPIYIVGFSMFLIWVIPSAVAQNIQTMLIARFLDGFSGSAFLSVAGGTVGDMFTKETLAAPMMIYSAAPFLGPGMHIHLLDFNSLTVSRYWPNSGGLCQLLH